MSCLTLVSFTRFYGYRASPLHCLFIQLLHVTVCVYSIAVKSDLIVFNQLLSQIHIGYFEDSFFLRLNRFPIPLDAVRY